MAESVILQASLIEDLPPLQRLALVYAPAAARGPIAALLALDRRLASLLRASREPMLAQLRLAWWREQLKAEPATWPSGEPLLAALQGWAARREALVGLVDGWEAMTVPAPLPAEALALLAQSRGDAFGALAELVGAEKDRGEAARLGMEWAAADLAAHLADPEERRLARALAAVQDWRRAELPRSLRPLVVLHGLAARTMKRQDAKASPWTLLAAMRLGLLGR